jgi:hypothetical protein
MHAKILTARFAEQYTANERRQGIEQKLPTADTPFSEWEHRRVAAPHDARATFATSDRWPAIEYPIEA